MKHRLTLLTAALLLACMPPASAQKVSDLTAITGANVDAAADLLLISDISAGTSKKMTLAQLVNVPALFGSVSATELGYLDGVTSAIQTQLNLKAPLISPSFTTPALGTPTSGNFSSGTFTWPTFNQSTTGNAATATLASTVTTNANLTGVVTSTGNATAIADGAIGVAKISGLGTAATTAATAYATATQGVAATGGPLRVACVGTSITSQSSVLATDFVPRINDLTNGHAGWLEHLSNHRVRLSRRSGVGETLTDKTFGYGGRGLADLTNGVAGLYPLDNAIASGAEVLVLEGGSNDIVGSDSAATIALVTAYWTKAVASGKRVIALNIPPVGGAYGLAASAMVNGNTYEISVVGTTVWTDFGASANTVGTVFVKSGATPGATTGSVIGKSEAFATTRKDHITAVNAALPAIATSLGVTLIDTHSVATLSSGLATVESFWDGLHPSPAYAHRLAVLINAQLASSYANRAPAVIVPAPASAVWITTNNSPSQASIPTGWGAPAGYTPTWSAITDGDGTTWQRVRVLQTGAANSANAVYIRQSTTGYTAGDRVRMSARIRGVSMDATEFIIYGRMWDTAARFFVAVTGGSNLGTGNYDPVTGLFVSPEFTLPTGSISFVEAAIEIYNVDSTVDIRQFGVFKVLANP